MNAYAYKAALYCEDCAAAIRQRLARIGRAADTGDSETYPQGPYSNGGGEADSPQHCDACGLFLQNTLTSDGDKYVRDLAADYEAPDASWHEVAEKARSFGRSALGDWIDFYYSPGL